MNWSKVVSSKGASVLSSPNLGFRNVLEEFQGLRIGEGTLVLDRESGKDLLDGNFDLDNQKTSSSRLLNLGNSSYQQRIIQFNIIF